MLEASYQLSNVSTHSLSSSGYNSLFSLFEHQIKFLTCIYSQVKKNCIFLTIKLGSEEQDADYEGHKQAVSDGVQQIQVAHLTHSPGHRSLSGKLSRISVFKW